MNGCNETELFSNRVTLTARIIVTCLIIESEIIRYTVIEVLLFVISYIVAGLRV
jgi:hypothetical protein